MGDVMPVAIIDKAIADWVAMHGNIQATDDDGWTIGLHVIYNLEQVHGFTITPPKAPGDE